MSAAILPRTVYSSIPMLASLFGIADESATSASRSIPPPMANARRADTPSAATPSVARKLRRFSMSSSGVVTSQNMARRSGRGNGLTRFARTRGELS
jgi:hypothetical protein